MVSEHTRHLIIKATKWIAGIALVLAIGLIAFQLVPQRTARQVPDASDSVAMERIEAIVDASVVRPALFVEYDKGALRVALPTGMLERDPAYFDTIAKICANFSGANILVTDIGLLNNTGTSGLFITNVSEVCDHLSTDEPFEEKVAVIDAATSTAPKHVENEGTFWKTPEGRALFGPPAHSPKASVEAIAALPNLNVSALLVDDLALYAPVHVAIAQDQLIIALPRNVVTPEVIGPILTTLCQSADALDNSWDGPPVSRLVILNRYFAQGLAIEGDAAQCGEYMTLSGAAAKSYRNERIVSLMCPDSVTDCLNLDRTTTP